MSADLPNASDAHAPDAAAIDTLHDDLATLGSASDELGADWLDDAAPSHANAAGGGEQAAPAPLAMRETLRRVPVKLTLEVGAARLTLGELAALRADDVLSLDRPAGAPLSVLVNGVPVGLAEVVVSGTQYGLKILTLDAIELDRLAQ
ncbi:FliM/FliN family flagellar motor switch protein [Pandoraea nosoerga]|nr:FliM/FliN family flagellar motor switch protein [Pandoraea nosoerga]